MLDIPCHNASTLKYNMHHRYSMSISTPKIKACGWRTLKRKTTTSTTTYWQNLFVTILGCTMLYTTSPEKTIQPRGDLKDPATR